MPSKAVANLLPASIDHDELMTILGQTGMTPKASESGFRRMSLTGGSLVTDPGQPNEEHWPPTKRGPTMTVRIVKPPVYYNSFFLDASESNGAVDGGRIGRPDLNGKFVKKYDNPENGNEWDNSEVFDDLAKATGKRGSFKGDIQLQIVPDDGVLTGEEPIYTLALSTTSAMDFRGSAKNPSGGIVQDKNFTVQLGEFAIAKAIEEGRDPRQAILDAMTALQLGGVVAEIYLIQSSNEDKSIVWTVVAFKPIHVELGDTAPALTEGETTVDPVAANDDDLPF